MATWTNEKTLCLIRGVEREGSIWNRYTEHYKSIDHVKMAWVRVRSNLKDEFSPEEIEKKWKWCVSTFKSKVRETRGLLWDFYKPMMFIQYVDADSVSMR